MRKRIGNPLSRRRHKSRNPLVILFIAILVVITAIFFFLAGRMLELFQADASSPALRKKVELEIADLTTIQGVKNEFHRRYGDRAKDVLQEGLKHYGSMHATARRIQVAAERKRPFIMGFAGYSVTVGRGNHFKQSFPFVLERILKPVFEKALGIDVVVRNGAIGGVPSYPYGFCFEHFLGSDLDVVSWDFSMNEGSGSAVLESYVRQSQHQLPKRPMVIALDTNKQRCRLLHEYTEKGLIKDAMCVGMAKDVVEPTFLKLPDEEKPPGFQRWDEFGAPEKCPGRGSWHPKLMEHELIGWVMAMYFIEALEVASSGKQLEALHHPQIPGFPKPLSNHLPENDVSINNLLYGRLDATGKEYQLKDVSCRTNFLPASDHDKVLPSIVVSGLSPGITVENIIEQRSDEAYAKGWVLDVSTIERQTKVKVEQCGGLGYVDMKIALYGIPESGTLRMWLPLEGKSPKNAASLGDNAKDYFDTLVICEANEKRFKDACRLDHDIQYVVGGLTVQNPTMMAGAAEYLKRRTCVNVGVPEGSKITRLSDVKDTNGNLLSSNARKRLVSGASVTDDRVGVLLDVQAKSNVKRSDGACCISHVVWENH